jgi:UDP-N-acetylmuramoyl-tripeptide--D-alanyl-D-alanine ligase
MDIKKLHHLFLKSKGISTDTRNIKNGQIFFALKGDNFNGNKYAQAAIDNGATYAIIDELEYAKTKQFILVDDVLESLQELAAFHRGFLAIPIIAITGTNGKTTTKELINTILSRKYNTVATKGNLNNHIGVPLTLLSMNKNTQIGIVEMGANHVGEIEKLCLIAKPDYGLITNIGTAHLEGFGSVESIVKAKNELYHFIAGTKGSLFVNGDDDLLMKLSVENSRKIYSENSNHSCKAKMLKSDTFLKLEWKEQQITTKLVGAYNFQNALAAICIGQYFKVNNEDVISAIKEYEPGNQRSQLMETGNNKLIIDAYNANPTSMRLAVENFAHISAKNKLLILGDMLEMGESAYSEHKKMIDLVSKLKFKHTYFVGKEFMKFDEKRSKNKFFSNVSELNKYLKKQATKNNFVLLKASRGIGLERTIPFL